MIESLTVSFSSLTKSTKAVNPDSFFRFLLTNRTLFDHLLIAPPGGSDNSIRITLGTSRIFNVCIYVILSHLVLLHTYCHTGKLSNFWYFLFPSHWTKNEIFHWGFLQWMWPNPQKTVDLVTFTEKILDGKDLLFYAVSGSPGLMYGSHVLVFFEYSQITLCGSPYTWYIVSFVVSFCIQFLIIPSTCIFN